jgi:hypothetical protein
MMDVVKLRAVLVLLWPLLGCLSASTTGVAGSPGGCKGEGCAHGGAITGAVAGGGSSGGVSGSGGGSTGSGGGSSSGTAGTTGALGSSSGGSSGSSGGGSNGICVPVPLPDGGGCANGAFVSAVDDLFSCAPIVGATVQALDADGLPLSGSVTTAADGTFVLCGPLGSAFTPSFSAPSYPTTYYPEMQAGLASSLSDLDLITSDDVDALGAFAPGGFDSSLGMVLVHMNSSSACPNPSGWSFSLTGVDGGSLPDGGYLEVYLGASDAPDPSLTATSTEGVAFFYNIDTEATNYFEVSWSNPDAGGCAPILRTAFYTGRLYIQDNSTSFEILQVP